MTPAALAKRDLEDKILAMRREGRDFDYIGNELGIPTKRVLVLHRRILAKWNEQRRFDVESERFTMLSRLDDLVAVYHPMATGRAEQTVISPQGVPVKIKIADKEAARLVLALDKRRSELIGADAPKKVEADVKQTHSIDDELIQALRARKAKATVPVAIEAPVVDIECAAQ